MLLNRKNVIKFLLISLILLTGYTAFASYMPTPRDTLLPPDEYSYDIKLIDDYQMILETEHLSYYFREDRDIIAIIDNRNGYVWKTGLDVGFSKDIKNECSDALESEKAVVCKPIEDKLNSTYTALANSLLSIEYFDSTLNLKKLSSASEKGVKSTLLTVNDDPSHRVLDIDFTQIDLQIKLHIYFDEKGISYEIKDDEIIGKGTKTLASITLNPFLGASGGQTLNYNKDTDDYDIREVKPQIPGYMFVPDGSGALIRFNDNSVPLKEYIGDVYGPDYAQGEYYYFKEEGYTPLKNPVMPVYGISHGYNQSAFVGFATKGSEYMQIVAFPEENMTYYNNVFPRFIYNNLYHQVYNKKGDGYYATLKERNHFDINMRYEFIEGDGTDDGIAADYVGMALTYRKYLETNGLFSEFQQTANDIPLRLEFVMSDIKKSVLGYENVVVTNYEDLNNILQELIELDINNINVGIQGWQDKGIYGAKPWETEWNNNIGSKKEFMTLINNFAKLGIDISFSQDYFTINSLQMNNTNNSVMHVNNWYVNKRLAQDNLGLNNIYFAIPSKSIEWLNKQYKQLSNTNIKSHTINGISNNLISHYGKNSINITESMDLISKAFEELNGKTSINAYSPNNYLWKYVDRFLLSPVYSSQYIIETDTVPFLQIVLNNKMEVYAPYANFSFYNEKDILRMIDYNTYPSFILTKEPSYLLSLTNSSDLYSTEYNQYRELIDKVYKEVNDVLKHVINANWTNRVVVSDGVIINTYDNGEKVVINYTEEDVTINNVVIKALSAQLLR